MKSILKRIILLLIFIIPITGWSLIFSLPSKGNDIVGHNQVIEVASGEDANFICQKYHIGYLELLEANPQVDINDLWPGMKLTIPTQYILPNAPRNGIVINVSELRLYYYPPNQNIVITYPIGIGREGEETPVMQGKIIEKMIDPPWHPTPFTRDLAKEMGIELPAVIEPGPQNPLGPYAMRLSDPNYLIHGTNDPLGVGLRISGGCIRMYNEDIEDLFHRVKIGTPVNIVAQPFKVGFKNKELYLEAHVPVDFKKGKAKHVTKPAVAMIMSIAKRRHAEINWEEALDTAQLQDGIPTAIGHL